MFAVIKTRDYDIDTLGAFSTYSLATKCMKEDFCREFEDYHGISYETNEDNGNEAVCGDTFAHLESEEILNWKVIQTGKKFYYTFGSDEKFPLQNGWVVVVADNQKEADAIFRENFPDKPGHERSLNCSVSYTDEQWAEMDPEHNWKGYKCHGTYYRAY